MQIVVISLERSTDRRRHMAAEFARVGVTFEFLNAVDGARGDHPLLRHYDPARCIRFYGKPLTPGALGCYASHVLAWQRCVDSGEPLLVMEDDVHFRPSLPHALSILQPLMAEYPLIRLHGLNKQRCRVLRKIDDMELIRFLRGPAGTQCYAVSPRGAAVLLAGSAWWREPVDRYVDRFWTHGVQSLALRPSPIVWTNDWGSETRIWESKSTPYTLVRKTVRVGEHVMRHLYNLREDVKTLMGRSRPSPAPRTRDPTGLRDA